MPEFLVSLLLVAVAQIPLLLKLWLDHKGAIAGFKLELYKRQLEMSEKLSSDLCQVQDNCEAMVTLLNEGSIPEKNDRTFSVDLGTQYQNNISALMDSARDTEIFLPSDVCIIIPKYLTHSTRLLVKAFVPDASTTDLSSNEIWEELQLLFNTIFNRLRIICGTDVLSKNTLQQFNSAAANKTILVVRQHEP